MRKTDTISLACVARQAFPWGLGSKNEERESKTARKNGSCFISRAAKTENPVPRSFFAPKPNGNACYAGYDILKWAILRNQEKRNDHTDEKIIEQKKVYAWAKSNYINITALQSRKIIKNYLVFQFFFQINEAGSY